MRIFVTVIGVIAALALLLVSMAMNVRFGMSLADNETDKLIYAAGSGGVDLLKCLIPFIVGWSIAHKNWGVVIFGAILFVVATVYSLTAAVGFAAMTRTEASATRGSSVEQVQLLRSEIERIEGRATTLGSGRPSATVQAALDTARDNRRWRTTEGCQNVTAARSRTFCAAYRELEAELSASKRREEVATELQAARERLGTMLRLRPAATAPAGDPQLKALKELTGADIGSVRLMLIVLLAVLMELGSGLGLFIATGAWRSAVPRDTVPGVAVAPAVSPEAFRPVPVAEIAGAAGVVEPVNEPESGEGGVALPGNPAKFATACLEVAPDEEALLHDIHLSYRVWCHIHGFEPVQEQAFQNLFVPLVREVGVELAPRGGDTALLDIAVVFPDDVAQKAMVASRNLGLTIPRLSEGF